MCISNKVFIRHKISIEVILTITQHNSSFVNERPAKNKLVHYCYWLVCSVEQSQFMAWLELNLNWHSNLSCVGPILDTLASGLHRMLVLLWGWEWNIWRWCCKERFFIESIKWLTSLSLFFMRLSYNNEVSSVGGPWCLQDVGFFNLLPRSHGILYVCKIVSLHTFEIRKDLLWCDATVIHLITDMFFHLS